MRPHGSAPVCFVGVCAVVEEMEFRESARPTPPPAHVPRRHCLRSPHSETHAVRGRGTPKCAPLRLFRLSFSSLSLSVSRSTLPLSRTHSSTPPRDPKTSRRALPHVHVRLARVEAPVVELARPQDAHRVHVRPAPVHPVEPEKATHPTRWGKREERNERRNGPSATLRNPRTGCPSSRPCSARRPPTCTSRSPRTACPRSRPVANNLGLVSVAEPPKPPPQSANPLPSCAPRTRRRTPQRTCPSPSARRSSTRPRGSRDRPRRPRGRAAPCARPPPSTRPLRFHPSATIPVRGTSVREGRTTRARDGSSEAVGTRRTVPRAVVEDEGARARRPALRLRRTTTACAGGRRCSRCCRGCHPGRREESRESGRPFRRTSPRAPPHGRRRE